MTTALPFHEQTYETALVYLCPSRQEIESALHWAPAHDGYPVPAEDGLSELWVMTQFSYIRAGMIVYDVLLRDYHKSLVHYSWTSVSCKAEGVDGVWVTATLLAVISTRPWTATDDAALAGPGLPTRVISSESRHPRS